MYLYNRRIHVYVTRQKSQKRNPIGERRRKPVGDSGEHFKYTIITVLYENYTYTVLLIDRYCRKSRPWQVLRCYGSSME